MKKKVVNAILVFFIIVCIGLLIYSGYNIFLWHKSNEDIAYYNFKNKIYCKNNKLKKKAKFLNNNFFANLSSSKLLSHKNTTNEDKPIKKTVNKNICFYLASKTC